VVVERAVHVWAVMPHCTIACRCWCVLVGIAAQRLPCYRDALTVVRVLLAGLWEFAEPHLYLFGQ